MKNIFLLFLSLTFILQVNAQQSKTGKYRPSNVSKGLIISSNKSQVLIPNVPSYIWQHGCGPTALGMVVGYYDMLGFDDLIIGDASIQTDDVNNTMANTEHYDDYSFPEDYYPNLEQDNSELGGAHSSNCIADFMETSWSSEGNYYGWSWSNKIDDAFRNYIQLQNSEYLTTTTYDMFDATSWANYKNEIDNNRPVVLLVDTDGNNSTDHFVTGIGYDEANLYYGIYDTWDNQIHWFEWRGKEVGNEWGIYGFNILQISNIISVNENRKNENDISVFPIPANEFINIELNNRNLSYNNINVYLYNYLGCLSLTKHFSKNSNVFKLDVSKINSGTYFLKVVIDDAEIETKKISIIR